MNFILGAMTDLPYFMPLVIEGNHRKYKSNFFLKEDNKKYNSPYYEKNARFLLDLSRRYNFNIFHEKDIKNYSGLTFLLEGGGSKQLTSSHVGVSLVRLTDFTILYQRYVNDVDYIVFPSRHIAEYYDEPWVYPIGNFKAGNTMSNKNLYLGCPKYDQLIKSEEVFRRIPQLDPKEKYCLIVSPQKSLMNNIDNFKSLITVVSGMGYKILVKSRGKDPAPNYFKGDYYFEDASWYPHDTMSLLTISDFYINFGSTVVKEGIMLKKSSVNFELKSFRHFDFLFDQPFNVCLDSLADQNRIKEAINHITTKNFNKEFEEVQNKYLQPVQNSSKQIIDYFVKKQTRL